MDKTISDIFFKQPDEIINGDYIYHLPYYEKWTAEIKNILGVPFNELKKDFSQTKNPIKSNFKLYWEKTTPYGKIDYFWDEPWVENFKGENKNNKTINIINKFATERKPFMDIASSESMGLAPYFAKMNPEIPCLVTDIDVATIKNIRSNINKYLSNYNINLACFDNLDIPLKDNSLDYITSKYGITSSSGTMIDGSKIDIYQYSTNRDKPIQEVYRVLKPGGRFITLEMNVECDFDLQTAYDYYNNNGNLFGIYTYDEIQAVLELLKEEPWNHKFTSTGFEVEVERKYYKKYSLKQVMKLLHELTNHFKIHDWEKCTWRDQLQIDSCEWGYKDKSKKAEDNGITFYGVDIFYILRKPDCSSQLVLTEN